MGTVLPCSMILQGFLEFPGVSRGQLLDADIVFLTPLTFSDIICLIEALLITDNCVLWL